MASVRIFKLPQNCGKYMGSIGVESLLNWVELKMEERENSGEKFGFDAFEKLIMFYRLERIKGGEELKGLQRLEKNTKVNLKNTSVHLRKVLGSGTGMVWLAIVEEEIDLPLIQFVVIGRNRGYVMNLEVNLSDGMSGPYSRG